LKKNIPLPRTNFLLVKCRCERKQTVFSAPSTEIKCLSCGHIIATPAGSKGIFEAKILKTLKG
jgi:ribosomal protein S27E